MNITKKFNKLRKYFCCEIPWKFLKRKDLYFPHPIGIVISEQTKIGSGTIIYSNVVIGGKNRDSLAYPVIGKNVTIYAGACVIGGIHIGDNSIIGANVTVFEDVPSDSVVINNSKLRFLNKN